MKNKTNNNKALIVSPYLDHLGGGERYMLMIASILQEEGWDVTIAWDNAKHVVDIATKMGIKLNPPKINATIKKLYFKSKFGEMRSATIGYDLAIYLSDGSIPLLGAKKNILHIQVPFQGVNGKSISNKLKLNSISEILVNSEFTKHIIDREYGVNSEILYPPVELIENNIKKEKLILSVGRFESSLNTKRHDILISAFQALENELKDWKLVLIGAAKSDSKNWIKELKRKIGKSKIELLTNLNHQELQDYYKRSTIYWLAGGYQIDAELKPEMTEHFGISTVEAISAGNIPFVIPKGGQREIIDNSIFYWETIDELINKTKLAIKTPSKYRKELALIKIKQYDIPSFRRNLLLFIS